MDHASGNEHGRQDPLVDAGVGVGDLLLGQRAARAAGADRVAQRPVLLDQVLLGHDQRLGLRGDVAVVAGVVERGRHHREAARQRGCRSSTSGAEPAWWSMPQLAPWVISSLWLNAPAAPTASTASPGRRGRRSGTGRGPGSRSRRARCRAPSCPGRSSSSRRRTAGSPGRRRRTARRRGLVLVRVGRRAGCTARRARRSGRPTAGPAGPEKTGPPFGWLTIVTLSRARAGQRRRAATLSPSARPVTRPSKRPFGRSAKALVTSRPPAVTVTAPG